MCSCSFQWGGCAHAVLLKKLTSYVSTLLVGYAAYASGEDATARAQVEGSGKAQKRRRTAKHWQGGQGDGQANDGGGRGGGGGRAVADSVLLAAVEAADVGMCCG